MNINQWLAELKRTWEEHDVDGAVALFSNDVEYWELPGQLVKPEDLHELWQGIYECINTKVVCEVYASEGQKHAVIWHARWEDEAGQETKKGGTYFVTLENGKCTYFYRTSMKEAI